VSGPTDATSRSAGVPVPSILSSPWSGRAKRDLGEPGSAPSPLRRRGAGGGCGRCSPAPRSPPGPFLPPTRCLKPRPRPGRAEPGRLPPASPRDGSFPGSSPSPGSGPLRSPFSRPPLGGGERVPQPPPQTPGTGPSGGRRGGTRGARARRCRGGAVTLGTGAGAGGCGVRSLRLPRGAESPRCCKGAPRLCPRRPLPVPSPAGTGQVGTWVVFVSIYLGDRRNRARLCLPRPPGARRDLPAQRAGGKGPLTNVRPKRVLLFLFFKKK